MIKPPSSKYSQTKNLNKWIDIEDIFNKQIILAYIAHSKQIKNWTIWKKNYRKNSNRTI